MKNFLQKYSGATHALATVWALLIGAYAGSDDFRAAVNAGAIAVYQSLPHGLAAVVSGLFGIAVPLWAFYRKGNPALGSEIPASSKGIGSAVIVALLVSSLALTTTGCTPQEEQQTVVSLTTSLVTALTTLENIEGNPVLAAQLQKDGAAVISAEANWKSGTPAQDVIEALGIVQADINLLPVSTQDQELVDLGIGLVDQILALLPVPAPGVVPARAILSTAVYATQGTTPLFRHPKLAKPIKDEKDFKKRWNALVKKHKELAGAKLK
jgi:hypothetical protein